MNSTDTWFTPVLYRVSDNCRTIHDYDAPFILVVVVVDLYLRLLYYLSSQASRARLVPTTLPIIYRRSLSGYLRLLRIYNYLSSQSQYTEYCVYYDCTELIVQDDEDRKSCFKSAKNRVCYSLSHMYTYIGTPNFLTNPLWVYQSSEVYTKKPIKRRRTLVNDSKLLEI